MSTSTMPGMTMPSTAASSMSSMSNMPSITISSSAASTLDSSLDALSTAGLDMTNATVQMDFLMQLLDDTEIQVTSNHYATIFWYGIVVVIGLATLLNVSLRFKSWSSLKAVAANTPTTGSKINDIYRPARLGRALVQKISYLQVSPTHRPRLFQVPSLGIIILVLVYLGFILGLEYVKQDVPGEQHDQAIGIRAGWLTITQMPLLILLSGKVNLIGLVSGMSYERLNVLHRWVARTMLLTATLHMAYQQALWNKLGLLQLEWSTDTCPPAGVRAYAFLVWLNLSTLAPIRNRFYEIFVIQHIISFICFITFVMLHLPDTALYTRVYIWIPIGLYFLDRSLRSLRYIWNNVRPARAALIRQHGNVTKIVVKSRQLKSWTPGSFVLIGMPRFGIMQSHPATIASVPSSNNGDLVFFLKAHRGFTSRIYPAATDTSDSQETSSSQTHLALIDGPYGGTHLDFANFGTVVLIAGSTGVTFMLPILLDLVFRAQKTKLVVKRIVFTWAVKTAKCTTWIEDELRHASEMLRSAGLELIIQVFVTADEEFVDYSSAENGRFHSHGDVNSEKHGCITNHLRTQEAATDAEKARSESNKSPAASNLSKVLEQKQNPPLYPKGIQNPLMSLSSGRPNICGIIAQAQKETKGEIGVAVCGPLGMTATTRRVVAGLEKADNGIYLHSENFGF